MTLTFGVPLSLLVTAGLAAAWTLLQLAELLPKRRTR